MQILIQNLRNFLRLSSSSFDNLQFHPVPLFTISLYVLRNETLRDLWELHRVISILHLSRFSPISTKYFYLFQYLNIYCHFLFDLLYSFFFIMCLSFYKNVSSYVRNKSGNNLLRYCEWLWIHSKYKDSKIHRMRIIRNFSTA